MRLRSLSASTILPKKPSDLGHTDVTEPPLGAEHGR